MLILLIGTFEDFGPIIVAVLGGFLWPEKILTATGIPSLISWVLIEINPDSVDFLIGTRLLAGFSNELLTGNVYIADVVPSKYISSFKSIEVGEIFCYFTINSFVLMS